jgi:hypothetical protein
MPPSSKRTSQSKTNDLNPVIISNNLNSTLNRLADVMEKTLDTATTTTTPAPSVAIPSSIPPPSESQSSQSLMSGPSSMSASVSPENILSQAIRFISADSILTEDELLAASLFFNSASDDAIRAARTFMALSSNQIVQRRFLLSQLETAALLPGRGKARANDNDDPSMMY